MGKSQHLTAGSDPIRISPSGLGPSWGLPIFLGRAVGRKQGQRDASREGVEGGGLQLRVEMEVWIGDGGCQWEGVQVWDSNQAAW